MVEKHLNIYMYIINTIIFKQLVTVYEFFVITFAFGAKLLISN